MYDFGENLRNLRKSKNLTQKRLAEKLEVTECNISKYESNMYYPPFDKLRSLAVILGVSMDELCGTESRETASLYNLTSEQKEIIRELINIFRRHNDGERDIFSYDEYKAIKKIIAELSE